MIWWRLLLLTWKPLLSTVLLSFCKLLCDLKFSPLTFVLSSFPCKF